MFTVSWTLFSLVVVFDEFEAEHVYDKYEMQTWHNSFSWSPSKLQSPRKQSSSICMQGCRKRGAGGTSLLPPVFAKTINPVSTRGADCPHHSIASPPDFQTLRRPWYVLGTFCFSSTKVQRRRKVLKSVDKVIIEKSRGGRFLWNRNWNLGWIWAKWPTFLPS